MDLLKAFLFGVTIAFSIGPIALLILNNGLMYGKKAALKSALGACLADFTFAIIAFTSGAFITSFLNEYEQHFKIVSSIVLIGFGLYMSYESIKNQKLKSQKSSKEKGFKTTYMLTIVNPMTILFFAAFIGQFTGIESMISVFTLAIAVFVGSFSIQTIIALSGVSLGKFIKDPKHMMWLQVASGLGIITFGIVGFL